VEIYSSSETHNVGNVDGSQRVQLAILLEVGAEAEAAVAAVAVVEARANQNQHRRHWEIRGLEIGGVKSVATCSSQGILSVDYVKLRSLLVAAVLNVSSQCDKSTR